MNVIDLKVNVLFTVLMLYVCTSCSNSLNEIPNEFHVCEDKQVKRHIENKLDVIYRSYASMQQWNHKLWFLILHHSLIPFYHVTLTEISYVSALSKFKQRTSTLKTACGSSEDIMGHNIGHNGTHRAPMGCAHLDSRHSASSVTVLVRHLFGVNFTFIEFDIDGDDLYCLEYARVSVLMELLTLTCHKYKQYFCGKRTPLTVLLPSSTVTVRVDHFLVWVAYKISFVYQVIEFQAFMAHGKENINYNAAIDESSYFDLRNSLEDSDSKASKFNLY